jgi:hypothetical protein
VLLGGRTLAGGHGGPVYTFGGDGNDLMMCVGRVGEGVYQCNLSGDAGDDNLYTDYNPNSYLWGGAGNDCLQKAVLGPLPPVYDCGDGTGDRSTGSTNGLNCESHTQQCP